MPKKKTISKFQRRLIFLSALGLILVLIFLLIRGNDLAFGPSETPLSPDNYSSKESPELNPLQKSQAQPNSIFNPPVHSLDQVNSLWLVVNKHRKLNPFSYEPTNLRFPNLLDPKVQNPYQQRLRDEVASAIEQVAVAMSNAGQGTLVLISGYRSFGEQDALYRRASETRGLDVAEQLVARAGFSEHQTGLTADVSAIGQGCEIAVCFGQTEAGVWLSKNSHNFGFIIRYPEEKEKITGYQYEPWHLRYVGLELATEMKERGIQTLEEFWKLEAAKDYLE